MKTAGDILEELLLPHGWSLIGGCRQEEGGRDVEEVERGSEEVEKGGEDAGDMKVEEEDQ